MRGVAAMLVGKRVPRTVFYSGALLGALVGVAAIKSLDVGPDFAVSILGAVLGGFLGAMLGAALVFDIHAKVVVRDRGSS